MITSYFFILLLCPLSLATIYILQGNISIERFDDMPALFGPPIPFEDGLEGLVVMAYPPSGCTVLRPPPKIAGYLGPFIAIIRRYDCNFVDKVLNAQIAGYEAVIVRNVNSNDREIMSAGKNGSEVLIPSVFVGEADGILIERHYQYDSGFAVVIFDDLPFDVKDYLLPFAITIGICFIILLSIMIVKCIREYRLSRRHRLSSKNLRKIPTHKFKKGDPYECCAVCLDDYIDDDKLRVLPCAHAYHTKCIDPWLTKNRRVCPVCKRKVLIGNERPSELDSDSDDERAPLLNSGTFGPHMENPFVAAENLVGTSSYNRLQEDFPEAQSDNENHPAAAFVVTPDAAIDVEVLSTKSHTSEGEHGNYNVDSTKANIV